MTPNLLPRIHTFSVRTTDDGNIAIRFAGSFEVHLSLGQTRTLMKMLGNAIVEIQRSLNENDPVD
jgi:hypothetical protein